MDGKFLGFTISFMGSGDDIESHIDFWEQNDDMWIGMQPEPEFMPPDQPWTLIEHEDDYIGIMHQLIAEELGYV